MRGIDVSGVSGVNETIGSGIDNREGNREESDNENEEKKTQSGLIHDKSDL